jgi:ABC-2 type transport system permease protein
LRLARETRLVIRREVNERMRSKSFVLATLALLLAVSTGAVIAAVVKDNVDYRVGFVDDSATAGLYDATRLQGHDAGLKIRGRTFGTERQARNGLKNGEVDALLVRGDGGIRLRFQDRRDNRLEGLVDGALSQLRVTRKLDQLDVGDAEARRLLRQPHVTTDVSDPKHESASAETIATGEVVLLYAAILTFGMFVAQGVAEEKSSRVVELLLTSLRPRQLLAGKLIGIGALGLAQFLLVAAGGVAVAEAVGAIHLPSTTAGSIAIALGLFLVGYALYASLFALVGALVSRQEDLRTVQAPVILVLAGFYFVSITALHEPDGTLAQVATFVPLSAPMAVAPRAALGALPAWQLAVAVGLTVATTLAFAALAARVYATVVLLTGAPVPLRAALRLAMRGGQVDTMQSVAKSATGEGGQAAAKAELEELDEVAVMNAEITRLRAEVARLSGSSSDGGDPGPAAASDRAAAPEPAALSSLRTAGRSMRRWVSHIPKRG